jgi:hypothetical protein
MEKIFVKRAPKQTEIAMHIFDKAYIKPKLVRRNKDHFILIKGTI